jgi:hypothetical protein
MLKDFGTSLDEVVAKRNSAKAVAAVD